MILGEDYNFRPHHYIITDFHRPSNLAVDPYPGVVTDFNLPAVSEICTLFNVYVLAGVLKKCL